LGPVVFYRGLWEQAGFGELFRRHFAERGFGYEMAEVIFALVAQRILEPASKLAGEHWINQVAYLPELEGVAVDLLYTALDELIVEQESIRKQMFFTATDLLKLDVSVLFYDTTSTYFEVEEPDAPGGLRRYGHSKDGRPDRAQMLVGVAVNRDGLPVRHWCFPGDTADLMTLETVLEELSALRPRNFYFVGDRAMVSQKVLDRLESLGLGYLLGVSRRAGWEAMHEAALAVRGRYKEVAENLRVKETTWQEGLRPVRLLQCFNPQQAEHDRALREATLEQLEGELTTLRQEGHHSKRACRLRSNLRFGPWLQETAAGRLTVDRVAVKQAARLDGKYVLLSNDLTADAAELARGYKDLQQAERFFGKLKGVVGLRPNYHQLEERITAHVLLCVLATFLVRLAELRSGRTHTEIHRTLEPLRTVTLRVEGQRAVHRTKLTAGMKEIFEKTALSPPPKILRIG
jgi:transposase